MGWFGSPQSAAAGTAAPPGGRVPAATTRRCCSPPRQEVWVNWVDVVDWLDQVGPKFSWGTRFHGVTGELDRGLVLGGWNRENLGGSKCNSTKLDATITLYRFTAKRYIRIG